MKVAVYETYLKKENGTMMHFDIIVPSHVKNTEVVFAIGRIFLDNKGHGQLNISDEECQFSLFQEAHVDWKPDLEKNGYHIIEFEGCRD